MDAESGALAAAAVLAQAFGIAGSPGDLLGAFAPLPTQAPLLAWTVELTANGDHVAFLVHAYDLTRVDGAGGDGRTAMEADLRVMAEAAARATPGPRLVAQAEAGGWGIVVAASPATVSRLQGAEANASPARRPASAKERARAADALLSALRNADKRAAAFLDAVGDASGGPTTGERALALFVADAPSLANLSQALRVAVSRGVPVQLASGEDPT